MFLFSFSEKKEFAKLPPKNKNAWGEAGPNLLPFS